ncbi:MAG: beta-aspartyl-peptidase, partial [Proteobacteria bacterium]
DGLDLIFEVVEKYFIRPDMFVPTHINRKGEIITEQALKLAELGAFIDSTCMNRVALDHERHLNSADFALIADKKGLYDRVCFSSDAGGSLPIWNEDHSRILGMGVGCPDSLLFELKRLVQDLGVPLEKALLPLTVTPATAYGLKGRKGELSVGADADLIAVDSTSMDICHVIAMGQIMVRDRVLEKKGYFE